MSAFVRKHAMIVHSVSNSQAALPDKVDFGYDDAYFSAHCVMFISFFMPSMSF